MTNVGSVDRFVRFVAGIVLIALCLLPPSAPVLAGLGALTWALAAIGAILIVTAAIRFCPAYRLVGMNTCGR
jgi:hypothetical protein